MSCYFKKYAGGLLGIFILLYWFIPLNECSGQNAAKQGKPVPSNFCISEQEMTLFRMVNEYRASNNLNPVPLSKSLSYVAQLHAKDLMLNHPDVGGCNFHSWSAKGNWTPFCYPRDENKKNSVWDKAKEITKYPAKAYEIVYWENVDLVPDSVMMVWQSEEYFNSFLLNTGKWMGQSWNAIGIAIFENYVSAWFGLAPDPEGMPYVCGAAPPPVDVKEPETTSTIPAQAPVDLPVAEKQQAVKGIGTWYIIVKTNMPVKAAEKFAADLRTQGYPDAVVLDPAGKIKIAAFGPADKPSAATKLKEIKQTYKDAWLYNKP